MVVKTNWPGAAARDVEQQVTDKIEQQAAGGAQRRLGAQLLEARRVAGVLRDQGLRAGRAGARDLVPGAQEGRRHPQHAASGNPGSVLQRRVRRHLHEHLRARRRRLRLPPAQGIRRPHPRRAAARAGRGQGRLHRRAGREGLHRAFEHQARDARRRAGADLPDARGAERGVGVGRVRHRHRPRLRASDRRVRLARRDPRHRDPRQRPRIPVGRHRARLPRLRRPAAAADALAGQGGAGHRRHDGAGWRRDRARRATSTREIARIQDAAARRGRDRDRHEHAAGGAALGQPVRALARRGGRDRARSCRC